jgi:hypothetical protein
MFERIISIDWSGAGSEADRVNLRVAEWDRSSDACRIELPSPASAARSWRRSECRTFLRQRLAQSQRTLVAMDFGFSLPWGSDHAVFGVQGWREMVRTLAALYAEAGTARATAQAINALPQFYGHGPFRFDDGRTDFRFYLDRGVAYYRQTELAAPQAISQWYLGSGGTVGFHSIAGMSALHELLTEREAGRLRFSVWPFEPVGPDEHILVESYPAICPKCDVDGECLGGDERDAWKVLRHLVEATKQEAIGNWFEPPRMPFGRAEGAAPEEQLAFEGFIFGLR